MLPKVDHLDRRILSAVEHAGDISCSQLARKLKRGRDTVEYRVQRLQESGIIKGFRAVVDFYKLGFYLHKCYVRLSCTVEIRRRCVERLKKHPRVMWIAECSGEWDVMIALAARSMHELYELEGVILAPMSEWLTATEVYTVVQFWVFRNRALIAPSSGAFALGTSPSQRDLDALDIEILRRIAVRSRVSMTILASEIGSSETIIRKRISRLEEERVILGYQADLNLEKLGLTHYKAQLYLHTFDVKEELGLRQFCSNHPAVMAYILQVGSCRVEIEMHASDYANYAGILDEIRTRFPRLVRETRTVLLQIQHFNWNVLRSEDAGT